MKFSGKMCFKIILKVTKNQGSTLSLEDTILPRVVVKIVRNRPENMQTGKTTQILQNQLLKDA